MYCSHFDPYVVTKSDCIVVMLCFLLCERKDFMCLHCWVMLSGRKFAIFIFGYLLLILMPAFFIMFDLILMNGDCILCHAKSHFCHLSIFPVSFIWCLEYVFFLSLLLVFLFFSCPKSRLGLSVSDWPCSNFSLRNQGFFFSSILHFIYSCNLFL